VGAGDGLSAPRLEDHVGQSKAREVLAHVISDIGPDIEQYTLALMVTGPILVRLAEITSHDRSVHGSDDLRQRNCFGTPSEDVAPTHPTFGSYETRTLETQQNLLQIGLGKSCPLGEVPHRGRGHDIVVERQTQQGPTGVIPTR